MENKLKKTFEEWQQAVHEFDDLNDEYAQGATEVEGLDTPGHTTLNVDSIKLFDEAWQKVKDKQDAHRKAIEEYSNRNRRS